jgi:DNA-binding MarR family transcriptional regulator
MFVSARNSGPGESAAPAFRSVAFLLSSLGYTVSRRFHQALEPVGLEPGEFALLRAVATNEGESQNALAERLHISPSWMVAIVDELERRGLLERQPHARDRRVRNLHLTAAGKKLLKQVQREAQQFDREVTGPFDEGERQQLLELLDRVAAALGVEPGAHTAMRG